MAVTAMKVKSSVESLREIVQDLLVPELKALKVDTSSIRHEMTSSLDALRTEMRLRDEKQAQAIKHIDDKLTEATRHISENIKQLSDKLDSSVECRERLAALEAKASSK
jgi:hypothetical protein